MHIYVILQDTIVALQALADYAALVYGEGTNMNIEVSGRRYAKTFSVADYNSLLLQRDAVSLPNSLTIAASGSGCCLVQVSAIMMQDPRFIIVHKKSLVSPSKKRIVVK